MYSRYNVGMSNLHRCKKCSYGYLGTKHTCETQERKNRITAMKAKIAQEALKYAERKMNTVIISCQICFTKVERKTWKQKYCIFCRYEINKKRANERNHRIREKNKLRHAQV